MWFNISFMIIYQLQLYCTFLSQRYHLSRKVHTTVPSVDIAQLISLIQSSKRS